jgi:hypothetical protein
MAYVGSEGSSSGFHRCFSSTVAMNLLVDSDGQYCHILLDFVCLPEPRSACRLYRHRL